MSNTNTPLDSISFDHQDKDLFLLDNLSLKADAIKHSILPRMTVIANELVFIMNQIYGFNILEDSSIVKSPNFRTTKNRASVKLNYNYCISGISGVRKNNYWIGFEKKNSKTANVLPFKLEFNLDDSGLFFMLHNMYLNDWKVESLNKLFHFTIANSALIQSLLLLSKSSPSLFYDKDSAPILPFKDHIELHIEKEWRELIYEGPIIKFPISNSEIKSLIIGALYLSPIYLAYINIAKNQESNFEEYVKLLNQWLKTNPNYFTEKVDPLTEKNIPNIDLESLDLKLKVMPGIRWQVFQRDLWRCVSCGRSSEDNVILHVDHIIPRSKGGQDKLENYQTLCHICNIGKSNKDNTNLRNR